MALALLLCMLPVTARATTLVYTSPCYLMWSGKVWDEVHLDSIPATSCAPGDSAREHIWVSLWKHSGLPGATAVPVDSHLVAPCREDSFLGQGPGHYYLKTRNSAGPGCASVGLTIMPGDLTGVDPSPVDPIMAIMLFDVRGRRVATIDRMWWNYRILPRRDLPSGVYFLRAITKGHRILPDRKVMVLR